MCVTYQALLDIDDIDQLKDDDYYEQEDDDDNDDEMKVLKYVLVNVAIHHWRLSQRGYCIRHFLRYL